MSQCDDCGAVFCDRCGRDPQSTDGCDPVLFADGVTPPILRGNEPGLAPRQPLPERCHSCGARVGYSHHLYCDVEACPRCRGQLLFCDCWADLVDSHDPAADMAELERVFRKGTDPT